MANAIYPKYKEALISGSANVSLSGGTVKAVLVDTADYTYDAAHNFLDDVIAGARIGTAQTIANKTVTNGLFDGDDVTFSAVTGDQAEAIIIYIDTGSEATSWLVAYIDTGVTGLPVTPNGGNISITWNASGIFQL
jgi:hypothetical protein